MKSLFHSARIQILVGLLVMLALSGCCAAKQLAEQSQIQVHGKIVQKDFPGRPNYSSVAEGDELERCWILLLDAPFESKWQSTSPATDLPVGATEMQLVLNDKQHKQIRQFIGKRIRVTGECFAAHTGHHHTDWLMAVSELQQAGTN